MSQRKKTALEFLCIGQKSPKYRWITFTPQKNPRYLPDMIPILSLLPALVFYLRGCDSQRHVTTA